MTAHQMVCHLTDVFLMGTDQKPVSSASGWRDRASDLTVLGELLQRAASEDEFFRGRPHPIFGALSRAAWLRWGYLHVDHHLRQFGV